MPLGGGEGNSDSNGDGNGSCNGGGDSNGNSNGNGDGNGNGDDKMDGLLLVTKLAGDKSVNSCTMAYNDKSRQRATMQQSTSEGSSTGGRRLMRRLPEGNG